MTQPSTRQSRQVLAHSSGLLAAVLLLLLLAACRQDPPLPTLGEVPSFELIDQHAAPLTSADLGQRVALANFIYTYCTDTCPLLSENMGRVQEQLQADGLFGTRVVLLSFSLDPERDTPAALRAYGERFGADPVGWKMLTGNPDTLARVAIDMKVGRPILLPLTDRNPIVNVAHSNRFVLIDGSGQIRAYYSGQELEPDDVMRDIKRLVR